MQNSFSSGINIIPEEEYRCGKRLTPLKILHVVNRLYPGGAQTMLLSLLRVEKALGYDPRVLYLKDENMLGENLSRMEVEQYTLGIRRFVPSLSELKKVPLRLRRWQPDVVQAWMYHSDAASLYLKYVSGINAPIIWSVHHSIHSLQTEKINTRVVINALKRFDHIPYKTVFVSRTSALQHEAIGYNPDKISVIPNGFDLDRFRSNATARESVRAELGIGTDERLVGIFGRYDPLKDIPNFLSGLRKLIDVDGMSSVKAVLCGRDMTESNRTLVHLLERHNLRESVLLLGQRDDVECIYASVDLAVNSSKSEAFPMSVGEAMACEVPCVVTDVGDSAWIVADTGQVVSSENPQALADGILHILSLPEIERKALGAKARKRIESCFSLQSVARQYHDLYHEAVGVKAA